MSRQKNKVNELQHTVPFASGDLESAVHSSDSSSARYGLVHATGRHGSRYSLFK